MEGDETARWLKRGESTKSGNCFIVRAAPAWEGGRGDGEQGTIYGKSKVGQSSPGNNWTVEKVELRRHGSLRGHPRQRKGGNGPKR